MTQWCMVLRLLSNGLLYQKHCQKSKTSLLSQYMSSTQSASEGLFVILSQEHLDFLESTKVLLKSRHICTIEDFTIN
jgi:hypothetical protein